MLTYDEAIETWHRPHSSVLCITILEVVRASCISPASEVDDTQQGGLYDML